MRSAGCIINDILDRKIDAQVERTRLRPLAANAISIQTAIIALIALLAASLLILLNLSPEAIQISLFSSLMVFTYPLIKRFSYFPQVFLGFTFNIGVLVGAASISHTLPIQSIVLYIGCIFWTLAYDTVYGFMDIVDDKKIGVKSMAIKIDNIEPKLWLMFFYTVFVLCALFATFSISASKASFLMLIILLILLRKVQILDLNSPISCYEHFKHEPLVGIALCLIIVLSRF